MGWMGTRVLMELSPIALLVLATFVPAAVLSCAMLYPVRRGAERLGLLDRPGHRKVHTVPTPLGGGIGIWFAVLATFAVGTLAVGVCRRSPSLGFVAPATKIEVIGGNTVRCRSATQRPFSSSPPSSRCTLTEW